MLQSQRTLACDQSFASIEEERTVRGIEVDRMSGVAMSHLPELALCDGGEAMHLIYSSHEVYKKATARDLDNEPEGFSKIAYDSTSHFGGEARQVKDETCLVDNTSTPADPSLRSDDLKRLFERNKTLLDADQNGFVSEQEIDTAIEDRCIQGADAQLLDVLKQHQEELQDLSNDEWGFETTGISSADIEEFARLQSRRRADRSTSENELVGGVNFSLYRAGRSISQASHDLFANSVNPLESIKPEAVTQGQIGDCYFVSALASLAQNNPQAVKDMIQDNGNGTYTVTFPGDPANPVTVNAPTDAELGRYVAGSQYGTWPAIIEKAYGKYHDNAAVVPQDGIPEGSCTDAGVDILSPGGKDTDSIAWTDSEEIDRKMQQAIREGMPITAHTDNELGSLVGLSDNRTDELGLKGGHDYAVIGYDSATKTVRLRNPWGHDEPRDSEGNPRDGLDDGIFTMTLDEFQSNFNRVAYGQRS